MTNQTLYSLGLNSANMIKLYYSKEEGEGNKTKMKEFKYKELEVATQDFSSSHIIGRGSHGNIYKGTLGDGRVVAIKKQSLGLEKLQDNSKLDNEVGILSSLPQNQYLINLLATSRDSAKNTKVLVMEHMPNGNLHDLLHLASSSPPSWPKRAQIALRIARAVEFLHDSKPLIIHRDIKSANVLFDSTWNAKLADFGLAVRMSSNDSVSQRVHSVSPPAGTIGYLDPCYTTPCKLSAKNDVYSFGVVLLEIISGTKAIDVSRTPASIVDWAVPLIKENQIMELCDERVAVSRYMEGPITRILGIAARCVSSNQENRPSIREIVLEMDHCVIERPRFSIWVNMVQSLILLKRRRKMGSTKKKCAAAVAVAATTTIICTTQANSHLDITRKKLLVREILADFTLG